MSTLQSKQQCVRNPGARRGRAAFTLVEVLVALAVMMLLLTIILVPINMALDIFHIGKARNEVQQANNLVLNQLAAELRQAVFVYPNEAMPGITTKSPYTLITGTTSGNKPYYQIGTGAVNNTSRLDFILPARDSSGSIGVPLQASNYIVTYYARRLKPLMDDNVTNNPYDVYSNPILLWRAQYPFKNDDGTSFASYTATNTNNTSSRYPITASPYAGQVWLTQNAQAEPNLENISSYSATVQSSNHLSVTPRDMALYTPNADDTAALYRPDSSFICDDTNADGKIDRVTINLNMAKYDAIAARPESQRLRLTRVVDLPNVK